MKSLRLASPLVLISLLTTGCLFDGDEKVQPKEQSGQVAGPGGGAPAGHAGAVPLAPDPVAVPQVSESGATPASAPGATQPQAATAPTTKPQSAPAGAEANVIKGIVRDEQGDPVRGARIRIAGYTGKPNGLSAADFIREVISEANGAYRLSVPAGLYGVSGEADLPFDGKTYKALYLHPADGNCQQQMSSGGIVEDFVLRLTGFMQCFAGADPNHAGFYSGAAIALMHESPQSLPGDAKLTFTLTPTGPLADGSAGKVLTFTRTVAALGNYFGPLETTRTLHDIPLGRYRLTGSATLANGSRQAIRFGPWEKIGVPVSPVADYVVSFPAKVMLPYGLGQAEVGVYDAGWSGSDPAPAPSTPGATQPQPTTTTTAKPTATCTTYSEYVGSIPVPC